MNTQESIPYTAALSRLMWRWAVVLIVLIVVLMWASWRLGRAAERPPQTGTASVATAAPTEPAVEYYTCTMHPQIRQSTPGSCPICGMQLVPKYAGSDDPGVKPVASTQHVHAPAPAEKPKAWYRCTMPECGDVGSDDPDSRCPVCGMKREPVLTNAAGDAGDFEITLSDRARRLATLATEPAKPRYLYKRIRTVGKITYDETRHKMVSAWIGGRIDRLFADFSGMVVEKGDHLVEIYSPELLSAQEEYLQAVRSFGAMESGAPESSRGSAERLARSVRRKLELLGLTDRQIDAVTTAGEPQTHLVVYAPIGGTIAEKRAMEGMYVKTGDVLYEIADLTHVWLMLDVYEADLPWIQPFQGVRVMAEALPGESFEGYIAFVDPVVDPMTRTIKVRVNVANPQRKLKPEMFVTAEIAAAMGKGGRAASPAPAGRFACPMHPWETAETIEPCPICQMEMVPVESLPGYVQSGKANPVLSVPRQAVMQTGERALVYVEVMPGTYRGVEVHVGPIAQDEAGREFFPVLSGLSEGEAIVVRGNFAIDSQMQLAGKPSLFNARGWDTTPPHGTHDHDQQPPVQDTIAKEQTLCPVMGNPIQEDVFIEYKGVKVHFCCWGCDKKFKAEPEKYIPNLPPEIQKRIREAEADEKERSRG
jgi:Cu(I)/Ag(I) efflux system membrane fusion protein